MGSFLDPMADKVLIATLFISLTWQNLIPLSLTLLIVGRDAALVAAGFVIRYMSLPPPVSDKTDYVISLLKQVLDHTVDCFTFPMFLFNLFNNFFAENTQQIF